MLAYLQTLLPYLKDLATFGPYLVFGLYLLLRYVRTHWLTTKPAAGLVDRGIVTPAKVSEPTLAKTLQAEMQKIVNDKSAGMPYGPTMQVTKLADGSVHVAPLLTPKGEPINDGCDISIVDSTLVACWDGLNEKQMARELPLPGPDRGLELSTLEYDQLRPCYAEASEKTRAIEQKFIAEQRAKHAELQEAKKHWEQSATAPEPVTQNPMQQLTAAIQADAGYAWSWYCAMACSAQDEGVPHATAQKIAARFMGLAFHVVPTEPVLHIKDEQPPAPPSIVLPEATMLPSPSDHLWRALYKQPDKKP